VLGLWTSTIYLRHHYVADLLAGWVLAPVAIWVAPRMDGWWALRQRALGVAPALGAGPETEAGGAGTPPAEGAATSSRA
jgi:hypothetical protein